MSKVRGLNRFLEQAEQVRLISDPMMLDEYFLLREERKVEADGNISVQNLKYQVDAPLILAGKRIEVRYEPDWIGQGQYPLPIYVDDTKVGEARLVDFAANVRAKRARPGNPLEQETVPSNEAKPLHPVPPTLRFASIFGDEEGGSR